MTPTTVVAIAAVAFVGYQVAKSLYGTELEEVAILQGSIKDLSRTVENNRRNVENLIRNMG